MRDSGAQGDASAGGSVACRVKPYAKDFGEVRPSIDGFLCLMAGNTNPCVLLVRVLLHRLVFFRRPGDEDLLGAKQSN